MNHTGTMILMVCAFVLLGVSLPAATYAIPSPDFLGPVISWLIFMLSFVSLGFGLLTAWLARIVRFLTPKDRRITWCLLGFLFIACLSAIGYVGWSRYQVARPVFPIIPPPSSLSTTTHGVPTTTLHIVPSPVRGDLISSRVASSTILVPTSILKEVVQDPRWAENVFVLDIREAEEREVGVVDAPTTWIRYGDLINGAVDRIPRDRDVLVICWTSQRGSETVKWLRDHGVPRAFAVKGGLQGVLEDDKHGWIPDGLPWTGATNWSTAFDALEYAKRYSLADAKAFYDAGAVVIDVRETERFAVMHLDGAYHLPIRTAQTSLVSSTIALLGPTSTSVIIYADAYVNTFYAKVLQLRLFRQGYARAGMLIDPNHEWMKKGYPYKP